MNPATQLIILQMVGNAMNVRNRTYPSNDLMRLVIDSHGGSIVALQEQVENLPDRQLQIESLIEAAADCIRAAALLVDKVDRVDFIKLQMNLQIAATVTEPAPGTFQPAAELIKTANPNYN